MSDTVNQEAVRKSLASLRYVVDTAILCFCDPILEPSACPRSCFGSSNPKG